MKNYVDYKPANKVRTTKVFVIIFASISLIASIPMVMSGEGIGFALVGISLMLFLVAGLIEGLAQIVEAACEYSWEFSMKYSRPAEPKIDDSEVQ